MPDGLIRVEWTDDVAHAVGVEEFDFASLDSLEDRARECLATSQPLTPLVEEAAATILDTGPPAVIKRLVPRVFRAAGEEVLARVIVLLLDAPSPRFRIAAIAHEIGTTALGGESIPATAKRFGKTKQALAQEMERVRNALGFALPRPNQRSAEARDKMRACNYRHKG